MAREDTSARCEWCGNDTIYVDYHDKEWGVPEHDDRALFEKLILDGFQAGLSWITILRKRDTFRLAFDDFDPSKIAGYGADKVANLMADKGIVRNRQKIESAITSAQAWLRVMESGIGSFDQLIWKYTDGRTLHNEWRTMLHVPASTAESEAMSKELKSLGFRFCGPTISYAFMQAIGVVNDHLVDCFRYEELGGMRTR